MVRIRVYARIIPEDVYLKNLESSTPSRSTIPLTNEKQLMVVVEEPEKVSVGSLVIEFKQTFQRLFHESVVPLPRPTTSFLY